MRMTAIRVIVDNPHHARREQTGVVQSVVLSSERGFHVAVRFSDKIEVLTSKDFKIHPEDVRRMDAELKKERDFFLGQEENQL